MYIIIFSDCNHVTKTDIESAFSLPGDKYIFSAENNKSLELNKQEGICYYNKDREIVKFELNHLELIDISRIGTYGPFQFSIYNHNTGTIQQIKLNFRTIEFALPAAIKQIISASNFSNWSDYEAMLDIEKYKSQIKELQIQLDICKSSK